MDYNPQLNYRISQLLKLPVWIAGISFAIGTFILLFHFFGDRELSYFIGLLYLLIAGLTNAVIFTALVICSFIFKEYQNSILQQACILLINIPVAILYVYLVFAHPFSTPTDYQF